MNELRRFISICLLVFLAGCQSVQVNSSAHITTNEVVMALEDYGVSLAEADLPINVFGSKLGKVKPETYELNGKPFFIFEFNTEDDREKAVKEFANKTETMNLVSASTFEKRNILIFYVHEQNLDSNVPFEKDVKEAVDGISEG